MKLARVLNNAKGTQNLHLSNTQLCAIQTCNSALSSLTTCSFLLLWNFLVISWQKKNSFFLYSHLLHGCHDPISGILWCFSEKSCSCTASWRYLLPAQVRPLLSTTSCFTLHTTDQAKQDHKRKPLVISAVWKKAFKKKKTLQLVSVIL